MKPKKVFRSLVLLSTFSLMMVMTLSAYASSHVWVGNRLLNNGHETWDPVAGKWVTGLADGYTEGETAPFRVSLDGDTNGQQLKFVICLDLNVSNNGAFAFTDIESYNTTYNPVDPTDPPPTPDPTGEISGVSAVNATIDSVTALAENQATDGVNCGLKYLGWLVEFTVTDASQNTYIFYGGHVAAPGDTYDKQPAASGGEGVVPAGKGASAVNGTFQARIASKNSGDKTVPFKGADIDPIPLDFGDLPNDLYPTLIADGGPSHTIVGTDQVWLGGASDGPDAENDGQPNAAASGDDSDGNDDENGVTPVPDWDDGTNGGTVSVDISTSGTATGAWLCAWFDFGDKDGNPPDGSFDTGFESAVSIGTGQTFSFPIPAGTFAPDGSSSTSDVTVYARFRLFESNPGNCTSSTGFDGAASNGEVEDYVWTFTPTAVNLSGFGIDGTGQGLLVAAAVLFAGLGAATVFILRRREHSA